MKKKAKKNKRKAKKKNKKPKKFSLKRNKSKTSNEKVFENVIKIKSDWQKKASKQ